MPRFATARAAKEFLVSQIVEEAERENVPLSDVERKMLYFSETAWTLPDIMDVNDQFARECDQATYEKKIASLIRNAVKRIRNENPVEYAAWREAIRVLRKEDHYILVMVDRAGVSAGSASGRRNVAVLIAIIFGVAIAIAALAVHFGLTAPRTGTRYGHYVIDPRLNQIAGYIYISFAALCLCVLALMQFDRKQRIYKILNSLVAATRKIFGVRTDT
jgi:hypothetical protein